MLNWIDLMRQAQGGAGYDNMARAFGLRPDQVQLAVAALLPAFAMGLQRNAMNPNNMMQLMQLMTTGHYANFFENAAQAFSTQGRQEGKAVLDKLFGSDEVTRRVAHQAAQFSGVGTEVLNQLLPLVAAILTGGMFKIMAGQGALLGSMAEAWRAGAFPQASAPQGRGQPQSGNPWADMWTQWARGIAAPAEPPQQQANSANPFADMMATFLRATAAPAPPPQPEPERPEPPPSAPAQAWGQMMETGHEMQRKHLESLQAIFDSAWGRSTEKP